jgi:hypothetical protein
MEKSYYTKISEEFFKKEWSDYDWNWDFRELLRYLSDRRVNVSINKWSLWIETDQAPSIEILLYNPMKSEDQEWECKKLYETFCRWEWKWQEKIQQIKSFIISNI